MLPGFLSPDAVLQCRFLWLDCPEQPLQLLEDKIFADSFSGGQSGNWSCLRPIRPHDLRDARFRVGSVNFAQRIADFADCGIGAHCVNNVGHGIGVGHGAIAGGARFLCSRAL